MNTAYSGFRILSFVFYFHKKYSPCFFAFNFHFENKKLFAFNFHFENKKQNTRKHL